MTPTPEPWQCPACLAWLAPHVTEHRCEPPDSDVSASPPGGGGSEPCNVTVHVHGAVTSQRDLVEAIRKSLLKTAGRNWLA